MTHEWSKAFLAVLLLWSAELRTSPAAAQPEPRAPALIAAAGRALEAGDLETAEGQFGQAVELDPELALGWLGLSEVHERRGELVAALELARRAERLAPAQPVAVLGVGRLLARLGAVSEALSTLARVRELDPLELRAYLLPALLLRDAGRGDEAVELLELGLERGVGGPEVSEELGLLLLAAGQPQRSLETAENALKQHPRRSVLKLVAGLALAQDPERRSAAAPWLEEALELGVPEPGKVHLELATLLEEQGDGAAALAHLRQAERLLPEAPEVHYRLGTALRAAGDLEGARAALERFRELSRRRDAADWEAKEIGAALNEAQTLASQNRLPAALERVDEILAAHPREAQALALRAKVLFSLQRREEALASLVEARRLVPSRVEYHYLEGFFLVALERFDEAEAALRRALALDADLAEARELLDRIAARRGRGE